MYFAFALNVAALTMTVALAWQHGRAPHPLSIVLPLLGVWFLFPPVIRRLKQ